jgi:predicted nucleic acid-binding protein
LSGLSSRQTRRRTGPPLVDTGGIAYNTNVTRPNIILDTNILVAAQKSRSGASQKVLSLVGSGAFDVTVSIPLVLEYEDVLKRAMLGLGLDDRDVGELLDYLCDVAFHCKVFYLWRPYLSDPKNDMVLEVAVAGRCSTIVTFNERDFHGVEQFGIDVMRPGAFLRRIGAVP